MTNHRTRTPEAQMHTWMYKVTVKRHPLQSFVTEDLEVVERQVAQIMLNPKREVEIERIPRIEFDSRRGQFIAHAMNEKMSDVEINPTGFGHAARIRS